MTYEELEKLAMDSGFNHTAPLDVSTIEVRKEVRDACEQNTCNMYDLCWSCPPACGTLEECGNRIKAYHTGIILQSSIQLEDSFDFARASGVSAELPEWYRKLAEMYHCVFMDASKIVKASAADGVHLDAENQIRLGKAIYAKLCEEGIID